MADEPAPSALLLIVVGSTLRAEEADRPLAYYLKQQVEDALALRGPLNPPWRVCVITDVRWFHEDPLQALPTISLGGPGVNLLAQKWFEELPVALVVDQRFFIHMDPELEEPRVSIWGMDNADTQIAVASFVQRYLPKFLDHCIENVEEMLAYEPDDDDDDDDDDDED